MKGKKAGLIAFVATLTAALLVPLGIPTPAQSQSITLQVNIPFEFHVGNTKFPEGKYVVGNLGNGGAMRISDGNTHSIVILTNTVQNRDLASKRSVLVFNRYSDIYFLSEVRWGGYHEARGLRPASREYEVARMNSVPKSIEVGANR